ncbi:histone-lysine N-methyltransferase SETMAR-like [Oratosquilla oratoria]|uniref:histone-lysine N-methyltransferase SETMAR-like n=1 Tax=Oratosquilla oratoria TaxID=337810 RepID=UPI003F77382F
MGDTSRANQACKWQSVVELKELTHLLEMEKIEYRAVIKYLHLKGMSPSEVHKDMVQTLGDDSPSYATVKRWVAEFKRGRDSVKDEPKSGRPSAVTTPENIDHVLEMVMEGRRLSSRQIATRMGISQERAVNILTNELGMSKVSARWVPRLLTPDQKRTRRTMSAENLELFEADPENFMARFVTMDEFWVHHYQPETKEQSKQWKHASSPTPKKAKVTVSAGKVMASVCFFWDGRGVLLVDYLSKGHTITGQYYADLLRELRKKIRRKGQEC